MQMTQISRCILLGVLALALGSCNKDGEAPDSPQPPANPAPQPKPGQPKPGQPRPAPKPPKATPPSGDYKQQLLKLVNASRASGANCGGRSMPAVGPLKYNSKLSQAAKSHSQDMAAKNYFNHTSPDGRSPGDRIRATGYEGYGMGENIAAGVSTAQAVHKMWMGSSGHCRGIMNGRANEMGIGYAQGGSYRHLWTQVFGASR